MHYEVEQKYRVDNLDLVKSTLEAMQAVSCGRVTHLDRYYAHPQRDFSKTDEAFRLRKVGEQNFMTYKGPKIDRTTKSRFEEEVRLANGEAMLQSCDEIVRQLGFQPVAAVCKQRHSYSLSRKNFSVDVALDDVEQVGQFVELEINVEFAGEDTRQFQAARETLAELAAELNLSVVERRSYLELLLEQAEN
ncbi:MAG: class IV adenylate cyclase [Pirellulales bacterium]|nr:class IV adenylate cyclase [Pirellulales bacterium]